MSEEKWIMNEEEIDREVESLCRWAAGRAGCNCSCSSSGTDCFSCK